MHFIFINYDCRKYIYYCLSLVVCCYLVSQFSRYFALRILQEKQKIKKLKKKGKEKRKTK